MYKTSVATFMVSEVPESPVETQIQWVGETSVDGIEIAVFNETDVDWSQVLCLHIMYRS